MITIIAAVAANRAIGNANNLLWHLPADLRHFKALTKGATVVMGRNTWESLPKRPLPLRRNIVLTSNPETAEKIKLEGAETFPSLRSALEAVIGDDIFIIGGGKVYAEAMPLADRLELTEIKAVPDQADTWFPAIDPDAWHIIASEPGSENGIDYVFATYVRR